MTRSISVENIKDERVRAIVAAARHLAIEADEFSCNECSQEAIEKAIARVEELTFKYMEEQSRDL